MTRDIHTKKKHQTHTRPSSNPSSSESPLWALGLMSGTSADGVDAALLKTDGIHIYDYGPTHFLPYPPSLKDQIHQAYGSIPDFDTAPLSRAITEHHAQAAKETLAKTKNSVHLIGFHGQTLFHKPPLKKGENGETYQIGDGSFLASCLGIPVVEQFRVNDMAHGGHGAPLVPLFHQALVKNLIKPLCILNIGGVANLTWIGKNQENLLAFDVGPGNGLMDDWVRQHTAFSWDDRGMMAAKGIPNQTLIQKWLSHAFFSAPPPKSLDRQEFQKYMQDLAHLSFEDGLATLVDFTAASCQKAFEHLPKKPIFCLVSGGGVHNLTLMRSIEKRVKIPLHPASEHGFEADAIEAQAFAFLAVRSLKGLPLSLPSTTGVPYPLIGGQLCSI